KKCGITCLSTYSGNSTYDQFASSHQADLNAVMCHRSINYVADMLETKFGIPWIKVNFIGAEATAKSLRKIAQYFGDKKLCERVEAVIAEEMPEVDKALAEIKPRTAGKTAMLFVGGSRAHHYQELFGGLGMKTIAAGYEFAHRDDYEGRHVLPNLEVDADSRNIEELHVEADPARYKARRSDKELQKLAKSGLTFKEYEGMIPDMDKETIIIDDLNQYEAEKLVELMKPDIFCAGIKEKYSIQKLGVPMKQLHSYDSGGPYAGFRGAVNFYREIDRLVNSRVWSYMKAPWQVNPQLSATYQWE
ncbi:MAG: nitrogenase component 1, partial [Desulfobulbaceae bacterium]